MNLLERLELASHPQIGHYLLYNQSEAAKRIMSWFANALLGLNSKDLTLTTTRLTQIYQVSKCQISDKLTDHAIVRLVSKSNIANK